MKHAFTSTKPPVADPTKVGSREWDQPHIIVGRAVSANFTCTADDDLILATGGSAGISCTPLPSAPDGTVFIVMKFDAGAGGVTILGTINGQTNFVLTDRWQFVELLAYSGTWLIVRGGVAAAAGSLTGAVILAPTADQIISASASQGLILRSALSGSSIKLYCHDPIFGVPIIQLDSNTNGDCAISWTHNETQDFALYHHGSGAVLGIFDNSVGTDAFGIFGGVVFLRDLAIGGPGGLNGRIRLSGSTSGTATRTVDATVSKVIEDTLLQVPALIIPSSVLSGAFAQISGTHIRGQSTFQLPNLASADLAVESFTLMAEVAPPASASSPGVTGQIASDTNFFYRCIATNTWTRIALSWQRHTVGVTALSVDTTLDQSHDFIAATGGSGGITLTLPAPVSGAVYKIKKIDAGAGNVTISGTIDGDTSYILSNQWQYVELTAVSGGYLVTGNN